MISCYIGAINSNEVDFDHPINWLRGISTGCGRKVVISDPLMNAEQQLLTWIVSTLTHNTRGQKFDSTGHDLEGTAKEQISNEDDQLQ